MNFVTQPRNDQVVYLRSFTHFITFITFHHLSISYLYCMQMDKEIKELTHQRDLAQSYMKDLLQSVGEDHASRLRVYMFVFLII